MVFTFLELRILWVSLFLFSLLSAMLFYFLVYVVILDTLPDIMHEQLLVEFIRGLLFASAGTWEELLLLKKLRTE